MNSVYHITVYSMKPFLQLQARTFEMERLGLQRFEICREQEWAGGIHWWKVTDCCRIFFNFIVLPFYILACVLSKV